jgi:hypothetical protein
MILIIEANPLVKAAAAAPPTPTRTRGFDSERCIWKQLTADVCVPLGLMQRRPAKVQLVKLLHN